MKLAFVDCETTGLDVDLHSVWEVAAIIRDTETPIPESEEGETPNLHPQDKEYHWFLPVESLAFSDQFALKLGGFDDRHPQGIWNIDKKDGRSGHLAEEKISTLPAFAKHFIALTRNAHIVGMVPSFDEERLRRIVRSEGFTWGWHDQPIDVETLAVGHLLAGKDESEIATVKLPWKSEDISRCMGIEPDDYERHTAMGDARWARDLYDAVIELRY